MHPQRLQGHDWRHLSTLESTQAFCFDAVAQVQEGVKVGNRNMRNLMWVSRNEPLMLCRHGADVGGRRTRRHHRMAREECFLAIIRRVDGSADGVVASGAGSLL